MLFHQSYRNPLFRRRAATVFLGLAIFIGFLSGALTAPYAGDTYLLLMRRAAGYPVSIVGLFAGVLFPFLLTSYAVYISKRFYIYIVCFFKCFLFSFCACGISASFGDAGWLVQLLMQFSDLFALPVLWWFSFRHIHGGTHSFKKDFCIGIFVLALAGIFDYCMVSPFLVMLIDI